MDAFEGLHSVQLSSSPPPVSASNPGYEVLGSARSGVQVYSNATFYGKPGVLEHAQRRGRAKYPSHREETKEERCKVGRLVDLEPVPSPRGEGGGPADPRSTRPQEGAVTQVRSQVRGREGSRLEGATQLEGARGGEHEDNVSRLRSSSLEIREKGSEILREQLDAAQKEAHRMVHEANVKQAAAEKQLKEAQGKIDVLQAEVSALKTMVLTSTPSSPNRQAHPQLLSPGTRSRGASPRHGGGHTRNKSASWALPLASDGQCAVCRVPDLERPTESGQNLSQSVQSAVENNSLTIEPVAMSALPMHRIKLGDRESYYYISPSSRARITAACNFFTYIRYIQQGLVRHDAEQMFWEVTRLRREMTY
ncbi:unnamed protein product [Coregonus sp. 'balchen']|nr:unnamed protein product [Coregonus sp. 'balchen']